MDHPPLCRKTSTARPSQRTQFTLPAHAARRRAGDCPPRNRNRLGVRQSRRLESGPRLHCLRCSGLARRYTFALAARPFCGASAGRRRVHLGLGIFQLGHHSLVRQIAVGRGGHRHHVLMDHRTHERLQLHGRH